MYSYFFIDQSDIMKESKDFFIMNGKDLCHWHYLSPLSFSFPTFDSYLSFLIRCLYIFK